MSVLRDRFKQAIKQIVSGDNSSVNPSKYRVAIISTVNSDGTCVAILDGAGVVATPLYPVIKGQEVMLVFADTVSAIPLTPNTPDVDNILPPYLTGGVCRFLSDQVVIQEVGLQKIFFLDDRDLDTDNVWIVEPRAFKTFIGVRAGGAPSTFGPGTTVLSRSCGRFSADGFRVSTVYFNGSENLWRIRVRLLGPNIQDGDKITNPFITQPAFFAKAKIETDLIRPMIDGVNLYEIEDTWVDSNGDLFWLERVMYITTPTVFNGANLDYTILYKIPNAKGQATGQPVEMARWVTAVNVGGTIASFFVSGIVHIDVKKAIYRMWGPISMPLGNVFGIYGNPFDPGNYMHDSIFDAGGGYSQTVFITNQQVPVSNGPGIVYQSERQTTGLSRNFSTSLKISNVLFVGGKYVAGSDPNHVTVIDDVVRIIIHDGKLAIEEFVLPFARLESGFWGISNKQFNKNCMIMNKNNKGAIIEQDGTLHKSKPPDIENDSKKLVLVSPNQPDDPDNQIGPTFLRAFQDGSLAQTQGVMTKPLETLKPIGDTK